MPNHKDLLLGELLVRKEVISQKQLEKALSVQKTNDERLIGEILVELGYISDEELSNHLTDQATKENSYSNKLVDSISEDSTDQQSIGLTYFEKRKSAISFKVKSLWDRLHLSTNIVIIDIMHAWIIMLSIYLDDLPRGKDYKDTLNECIHILNQCIDYTNSHFKTEELLLKIMDYDISDHSKSHIDLINSLNLKKAIIEEININDARQTSQYIREFSSFLKEWFLNHIAIEDRQYSIYLHKNKDKYAFMKEWVQSIKSQNLIRITKDQKLFYDSLKNERDS